MMEMLMKIKYLIQDSVIHVKAKIALKIDERPEPNCILQ